MTIPTSPFPQLLKLVAAVILLIMMIYFSYRIIQLIQIKYYSNTTDGTITEYVTRESNAKFASDRKAEYAPVFVFNTVNGKVITIAGGHYLEAKQYKIGDEVKVYYNEKQPQQAYLDITMPWKRLIILWCVGFFGAAILIYTYIKPIMSF